MRLLALFVVATASLSHTSIAAQSAATFSVELRRGFNAATYATRDLRHPEGWIANFGAASRHEMCAVMLVVQRETRTNRRVGLGQGEE